MLAALYFALQFQQADCAHHLLLSCSFHGWKEVLFFFLFTLIKLSCECSGFKRCHQVPDFKLMSFMLISFMLKIPIVLCCVPSPGFRIYYTSNSLVELRYIEKRSVSSTKLNHTETFLIIYSDVTSYSTSSKTRTASLKQRWMVDINAHTNRQFHLLISNSNLIYIYFFSLINYVQLCCNERKAVTGDKRESLCSRYYG